MSVLLNERSRVAIQGITGDVGSWSAADLQSYGTQVVAGIVPGRGGTMFADVEVFDFAADAVGEAAADTLLVYVPATAAGDAVAEALESGASLVVYPGDGLPVQEAIRLRRLAHERGVTLIGANTPGLISPGQAKAGFMPSYCYAPGRLGVVSKSGSLSYEICLRLTEAGIGQSSVVGVGGDPVKGVTIGEALDLFDADPDTDGMLVLGEIGGLEEYEAARYAMRANAKPVAAFLVGRTAPLGRKLGHAGALIGGEREGWQAKAEALRAAGIEVAERMCELVPLVTRLLQDSNTVRTEAR